MFTMGSYNKLYDWTNLKLNSANPELDWDISIMPTLKCFILQKGLFK